MFLKVKPEDSFGSSSAQKGADRQMRTRFSDLMDSIETPTMYCISALGTHLCIYTQDTDRSFVLPEFIPEDEEYTVDVAPVEPWDIDVLTSEGRRGFGIW